jgi:2-hydroxychromene-2-carboxylate isomerase
LTEIFKELNIDHEETIKKANQQEIKDKYLSNTEYAYKKGVFGSPSFIYEGEVFWGDDRLEDCIKWIKLNK